MGTCNLLGPNCISKFHVRNIIKVELSGLGSVFGRIQSQLKKIKIKTKSLVGRPVTAWAIFAVTWLLTKLHIIARAIMLIGKTLVSNFERFYNPQTISNTLYYKYPSILCPYGMLKLYSFKKTFCRKSNLNSIILLTQPQDQKHQNTKWSNTNKIVYQIAFRVLKIRKCNWSSSL